MCVKGKSRKNECGHPERRHCVRGMCSSCYDKSRNVGERRAINIARGKTNQSEESWRAWRAKNLASQYGITLEHYEEMIACQDNKCSICGNSERSLLRGKIKKLSVDHDHATGQVRGLLCNDCNRLLGNAKDNIATLRQAILYLQLSKAFEVA